MLVTTALVLPPLGSSLSCCCCGCCRCCNCSTMATSTGSVIVMVVVMVMAMVAVAIPSLLLIFVRRIRTVGDSRRSFLQKSKPSRKKPRSISRSQARKHPPRHYVHCEDDHISSKPNTANKKRWKQQQEDDGTNVSVCLSVCWPTGCCCCSWSLFLSLEPSHWETLENQPSTKVTY
jgi:hypothetical protein